MKKTCKRIILYCILFVGLVIGITAILFPHFQKLSDPFYQSKIREWVNNMGIMGVIAILGLQILQIIIAFIPGEPVEILSGALYGTTGGLTLCLIGCVIASSIIFSLSKCFGKKLLYALFSKENVQSWKWLQDSKKCTMVTFILFFIPGTPKDMLTYVVGITDMSISKFLVISSLARVPSVLSSSMVGATMCRGDWEISVVAFFVTGIIGIAGIGFNEKIIDFCRSHSSRENCVGTACECLDFVEAAHRHKIYPLMYCYIEITGHLDINRLKAAVQQASHYVPEILYAYNFRQGKFTDIGLTADDTVLLGKSLFLWDLSTKPQLQININRQEKQDIVIVGMSHILTDGEGFLQFLYLLSFLYNEPRADFPYSNHREISPFLENIHVQKQTEQVKRGKRKSVPPLRAFNKGKNYFCLVSRISKDDFVLLRAKAKLSHVTLNDVFMTAYACIIARMKNTDTVILPCPADLRRFSHITDKLTIANLTGIYRRITIEIKPQHTFVETLLQIHTEMELQKSRYRCYAGINLLNSAFHKIPRTLLGQIIKANYRILPVSYTNIGRINHQKFNFDDCTIENCYITGTYRLPPDFQLSISTFQDVCTLNCTLIGQPGGRPNRTTHIGASKKNFWIRCKRTK